MTRYDSDLTIDEAILIATYHPDVSDVAEAFGRASRANTRDRPTSKADAWGEA